MNYLDRFFGVGVVARILIYIVVSLTCRIADSDAYFAFGRWILAAVVILEIVYDAYLSYRRRQTGGNAQR
ncbi:hypothetical protein WK99_27995 [Burkholderia ubonensis]|nr:hypothetical protein WK99_27995 [Burkholderia ubonensis]